MMEIQCIDCQQTSSDPLAWRCEACGGVLDFSAYPPFDADAIDAHDFSLWRYRAWLPVEQHVSLGEGLTPLARVRISDDDLLLKLEYLNPTGSYKDRGTVTMMNHMASHGVTNVVEDSSGNAGASVAAYSTALGIHPRIYVPAHGSARKKALIEHVGGELMEIGGTQEAKTIAARQAAATIPYASHAYSPYFVLGQMTVAFEVWEQCQRTAPDVIVTPLGHGGLFLGFARGFALLHAAGYVERVPTMIAVQSDHSDPIVRAYETGTSDPAPISTGQTIADGIIVADPVRGRAVLEAIATTGGAAFRVSDAAIQSARATLARHGYVAEPTSATTLAALPQVRAHVGTSASVVLALTGNGLKYI